MDDRCRNRRKKVLTVLSGIAQSAYKMCGDVRLLANLKEVEEPFAKTQVDVICSARHWLEDTAVYVQW